MTFSKKYKYRSLVKKKTNKFYFFFYLFNFLFEKEFFFLIFQKKSSFFDFNAERKEFSKKGFIFKKTSSTFLRHILKKYKPFFKGFTNLSFDFHFICYLKKNEGLSKAKNFIDIVKEKEISDKYQILLFFYKGRLFSNMITEDKIFNFNDLNKNRNLILYSSLKKLILEIKKIHLYYFSKKLIITKKNG